MLFRSNMLHNLRQLVDNDSIWRSILRGLNEEFYHQTVATNQIENYVNERVDIDLSSIFDQYLRDIRVPVFEYAFVDGNIRYRWANVIEEFNMPLAVQINGEKKWIYPKASWQRMELSESVNDFSIDKEFYVIPFNITPN